MKTSRLLLVAIAAFSSLLTNAQTRYKNPVYSSDFADPTVVRAKNGTFYTYATNCQMLSSTNFIRWSKQTSPISRPTWNDSTYVKDGKTVTDYYSLWACDVSYLDGKYYMQYASALWGNGSRTGIGVAVGDTPTKFTDKGKLFRSTEIGVENSIDPCFYQEKDKKYIIWGSFNDICIAELEDDGLKVKNFTPLNNPNNNPDKTRFSGAKKIAGGAFEGPMIYKRGKFYYLFCSIGSCCEGANSTYKTVVGRSTSLMGPYLNKKGGDMKYDNYEVVISGNSRWKGPGHNSEIVTDDEGQDWLLYHSYDMNNGCDGRLLLLDKINWVNDWPVVNDGHPSSDEQDGPVFYTGDGANMTYKMDNADFSMSEFKYWDLKTQGECTAVSSAGTGTLAPFVPFARITTDKTQSGTTFDLSQSLTGMKNGLYELKVQAVSVGQNVDLYVNHAHTAVAKYESTPSSDQTTQTNFLAGKHTQSVYGLVNNGKLTIGARSNAPMNVSDRFAIGNVRIIFRDRNAEVAKQLANTLAQNIADLDKEKRSFYKTYLTRLLSYSAIATNESTSDAERFSMLQKEQSTMDSISNSIVLYDSLSRQIALLESEIKRAGNDATESAKATLTEAKGVYENGSMMDKDVKTLLQRIIDEIRNMFYNYKEGDGTAENPYIIRTPEQLDHMHDVLVKSQVIYFKMDADVDMKDIEWTQLNTSAASNLYWINFDGNGHLIFNLHNAADEKINPSFFGTLCGECRNVGFVNANIQCANGTNGAIIAGSMGNASYKDESGLLPIIIENCYVTGSVNGKGNIGAIAGNLASSPIIIRNVYSAANVTGDYSSTTIVGGLVGRIRIDMQMENCYAAGNVTGTTSGGIIGGGQTSTTKASTFDNAFAWNFKVDGTTASALGGLRDGKDEMTDVYYFEEMEVNGSPVSDGVGSWKLRQKAAAWGEPWYKDPAAGYGRPILAWQYKRGDYKEYCGFDETTAIENILREDKDTNVSGIFDLSGRRVNKTAKHGIYIVDGKKIIR